jgi:hypothetical protein
MRRVVATILVAATLGLTGRPAVSAAVASRITIKRNATTERFHGKVTLSNAE